MKYLILFLLMACGSQEPKMKDLQDSDGDKVANAFEAPEEKFLAEFKALKPMAGILSVSLAKRELVKFAFSSQTDLEFEALTILAKGESKYKTPKYFSANSLVTLNSPTTYEFPKDESFQIMLQFENFQETPYSIAMLEEEDVREIIQWKEKVSFTLSYDKLMKLLKGQSHLILVPDAQDLTRFRSIKEKSQRTIFYDGKVARLAYVSKEHKMPALLQEMNLANAQDTDQVDLAWINEEETHWWFRETLTGDKAVMLSDAGSIKKRFLTTLPQEKLTLSRTNGSNQNVLKLDAEEKSEEHVAFVTIRDPKYIKRNFVTSIGKFNYWTGSKDDKSEVTCVYKVRSLASEENHKQQLDMVLADLQFKVDDQEIDRETAIFMQQEKLDVDGEPLLELGIRYSGQSLSISIPSLPAASYDSVGIISTECSRYYKINATPLHPEGNYAVLAEAYLQR